MGKLIVVVGLLGLLVYFSQESGYNVNQLIKHDPMGNRLGLTDEEQRDLYRFPESSIPGRVHPFRHAKIPDWQYQAK